jgi:hypothetical protein
MLILKPLRKREKISYKKVIDYSSAEKTDFFNFYYCLANVSPCNFLCLTLFKTYFWLFQQILNSQEMAYSFEKRLKKIFEEYYNL